jgi:hypothetical protein
MLGMHVFKDGNDGYFILQANHLLVFTFPGW